MRIIRAAKALGLRTVQVHSQADANSLAVKLADEAIDIGPPAAKKSYLNIEAVLAAAKAAKVDAVHPGYGFLSENADFAEAVEAAGHDLRRARRRRDPAAWRQGRGARRWRPGAGVPTVPGSDGRVSDIAEAVAVVSRIGFPVMIKAAAGGGGRGIRIAADAGGIRAPFPAGFARRPRPLSAMAASTSRR